MKDPEQIKIGNRTLREILEDHKHWLNEDCDDWEDMRACLNGDYLRTADLSHADLRHASLINADLSYANLHSAKLQGADLSGALLRCANLSDADLHDANLYNADLMDAFLHGTDLSHAFLRGANLKGAALRNANLYNTNLRGTNLCGAVLRGANLFDAKFNSSNLCGVYFSESKEDLIEYRRGKILTESVIGYKKCVDDVIVTLEIPRGAIVFSINGNKCRTNKAKVIAIDGETRALSSYKYLSYYVGDEFTVYNFNCEYNVECAEGIHFFLNVEEAFDYK